MLRIIHHTHYLDCSLQPHIRGNTLDYNKLTGTEHLSIQPMSRKTDQLILQEL
jgi:hypothetical protein